MFPIWAWNLKRYTLFLRSAGVRRAPRSQSSRDLPESETFNPEPVTEWSGNANRLHIYFSSFHAHPLWCKLYFPPFHKALWILQLLGEDGDVSWLSKEEQCYFWSLRPQFCLNVKTHWASNLQKWWFIQTAHYRPIGSVSVHLVHPLYIFIPFCFPPVVKLSCVLSSSLFVYCFCPNKYLDHNPETAQLILWSTSRHRKRRAHSGRPVGHAASQVIPWQAQVEWVTSAGTVNEACPWQRVTT